LINRIQELRKSRKLTQAELAAELEVTRQTVISLEKGKYNASLFLAHRIAKFFDLPIEDVFILKGEK
jgi:Predicted transcriptional regulators